MKQRVTMVIVNQHCTSCGEESFEWKSHLMALICSKYPAVNVLLSFAVLMAGASIREVLLVCKDLFVSSCHQLLGKVPS